MEKKAKGFDGDQERARLAGQKNHKITELQAREIKFFHLDEPNKHLAKLYGIHESQVSRIRTGKAWTRLVK